MLRYSYTFSEEVRYVQESVVNEPQKEHYIHVKGKRKVQEDIGSLKQTGCCCFFCFFLFFFNLFVFYISLWMWHLKRTLLWESNNVCTSTTNVH